MSLEHQSFCEKPFPLGKGSSLAYTSTPEDHVSELCRDIYKYCGINFTYINDNPEYIGNDYADFSKKFYYNILLDDKAGFEGETDWLLVKNELIRVGEW